MKRSNSLREIIALRKPGEGHVKKASTLKGLNMNSLKKTWGRACQKSLNPERVEYET